MKSFFNFHAQIQTKDAENQMIEGFASVNNKDRSEDYVPPEAFKVERFKQNPQLLYNHKFWKDENGNQKNIGKVKEVAVSEVKDIGSDSEWGIQDVETGNQISKVEKGRFPDVTVGTRGLWVRAEVEEEKVWNEIENGDLNSFSWRGLSDFAKALVGGAEQIIFKSIDLLEVSVVFVPDNFAANFEVAKGLSHGTDLMNLDSTKSEDMDVLEVQRMYFSPELFNEEGVKEWLTQHDMGGKSSVKSNDDKFEVVFADEENFEEGTLLSIGFETGVQVVVGKKKGTKSRDSDFEQMAMKVDGQKVYDDQKEENNMLFGNKKSKKEDQEKTVEPSKEARFPQASTTEDSAADLTNVTFEQMRDAYYAEKGYPEKEEDKPKDMSEASDDMKQWMASKSFFGNPEGQDFDTVVCGLAVNPETDAIVKGVVEEAKEGIEGLDENIQKGLTEKATTILQEKFEETQTEDKTGELQSENASKSGEDNSDDTSKEGSDSEDSTQKDGDTSEESKKSDDSEDTSKDDSDTSKEMPGENPSVSDWLSAINSNKWERLSEIFKAMQAFDEAVIDAPNESDELKALVNELIEILQGEVSSIKSADFENLADKIAEKSAEKSAEKLAEKMKEVMDSTDTAENVQAMKKQFEEILTGIGNDGNEGTDTEEEGTDHQKDFQRAITNLGEGLKQVNNKVEDMQKSAVSDSEDREATSERKEEDPNSVFGGMGWPFE